MNFDTPVQALCDAGVDFIIIGGLAAILHGSAHVTNDLDLFISRDPDNLKRLARVLQPFQPRLRDFPPELPFIWGAATLQNATVLTLETTLGPIDLLMEVAGLGLFAEANTGAIQVEAFGRMVRVLDLASLIRSKRAAGRGKDLAVVHELEGLLPPE